MKVSQILDLIDSGDIALPEFQRGYVWNRDQVRSLFASLYRGYPVGGFMTWNTRAESATARGGPVRVDGTVKLLLDGQQRATTLYGVIRGQPPEFFEGNKDTFTGLYFNLDDEVFEFFAKTKMQGNPAWVDVSRLMSTGLGGVMANCQRLSAGDNGRFNTYVSRANQLEQIKNRDVHLEEVTGADKTIDVVVDIFNRVNSGGTKLSKGDLALAKIGASWPGARQAMNVELDRWERAGYDFSLDWLLRGINAVVTGEALFTALADVPVTRIETALGQVTRYVDGWLNRASSRLGLDHDRVLVSRFALLVLARFVHLNDGRPPTAAEQDRLLAWFVYAGLWGRYAGSTETVLAQDLKAVDRAGVDGLMENLRGMRGDLSVRPEDFAGNSLGARFYPALYLLTRTHGSRDLGDGSALNAHMLGRLNTLQVHHIFPKARLYAAGRGFSRGEVNALANFCFLTQDTNLRISDRLPRDYLPEVAERLPGALESQWIPTDPALWELDRYRDFLAERRVMLAHSLDAFLRGLASADHPADLGSVGSTWDTSAPSTAGGARIVESDLDARTQEIDALVDWMVEQGCAPPEQDSEVVDPDSGAVLCVAEAFWRNGLQEGIGQPVVLELDLDGLGMAAFEGLGYQLFTSCAGLREFVERRRQV